MIGLTYGLWVNFRNLAYPVDAVVFNSRVFGVSVFSECSAGSGFCLELVVVGGVSWLISRGWGGSLRWSVPVPYFMPGMWSSTAFCRDCDVNLK